MSTQAYYKERLGFDPADTVAEHHREQRSQHGYEESLSKFKGQNGSPFLGNWSFVTSGTGNGDAIEEEFRPSSSQACWGCWAKFIEAYGKWHTFVLIFVCCCKKLLRIPLFLFYLNAFDIKLKDEQLLLSYNLFVKIFLGRFNVKNYQISIQILRHNDVKIQHFGMTSCLVGKIDSYPSENSVVMIFFSNIKVNF